jgi:predicted Zn-dependent peptidase
MNRTTLLASLLLGAACATPAATRSAAAPEPEQVAAERATLVEGDVTEGHLGGMTLLVKRLPGAELATAQLYVRGGSMNWTAATGGIEALAFQVAAQGGAGSLDKVAFARRLASLGVEVQARTTRDWSMVEAKGPVAAAPTLLELAADVFLRPALPGSEVEVARQRQLIGLQRLQEDPDARLGSLLDEVRFKGHPYAVRPDGSAATVRALTAAQLAEHLRGLREQDRLVLVVVGDVEFAAVRAQAQRLFGSLPRGRPGFSLPPLPPIPASALTVETRLMPTNYLEGVFLGPPPGTREYAAAVTATTLLRDRLFFEVRTRRNLSYAPGPVWELTAAGAYGGLYVTAVDPTTTWKVMLAELRRLQDEVVAAEDLAGAKAQARTRMLMRQESTDGQAGGLAEGLLLTADWRFRARLADSVKAVTGEDVQAYARKYFGRLQVVLLGDPSGLDAATATGL